MICKLMHTQSFSKGGVGLKVVKPVYKLVVQMYEGGQVMLEGSNDVWDTCHSKDPRAQIETCKPNGQ